MQDIHVWNNLESAQLCTAGRVYPDATWMFPAHAHTYWEFIYFISGTGRIHIPQGMMRPHQYHIVIYPPGLPHSEITDPVQPEETIFFGVDIHGTPPPGAHLLLPDMNGDLRWLCEHILAEFNNEGNSIITQSYIKAFLYLVERAWGSSIPIRHNLVDSAIQYLNSNFTQSITLKDVAESLCVSETHLIHKFTSQVGISPMRYLQQIRIEAAKRLLIATAMPINEIAAQVGFDDPLYFSRVFKQKMGTSPSSLRNSANCAIQSI